MGRKNKPNWLIRALKLVYLKLFRINASPFKIALGFGVGVFVGVAPGIGPPVALLLAFLFRLNRASTLLGSILFNTWVGVASLLFAAKIGAAVMGLEYRQVYDGWIDFLKTFNWGNLFSLSIYKILVPLAVGYLIIATCVAVSSAVVVYFAVCSMRNRKQKRSQK